MDSDSKKKDTPPDLITITNRIKTLVSSLCQLVVLWLMALLSPLHRHDDMISSRYLSMAQSPLILSSPSFVMKQQQQENIVESSNVMAMSTSSWSWGSMGDVIGTDSGVNYMSPDELTIINDGQLSDTATTTTTYNMSMISSNCEKQTIQLQKQENKYPPTMPLLAINNGYTSSGRLLKSSSSLSSPYSSSSLGGGHYNWVLNREYKNGRLILKETKSNNYSSGHLHARRENGRLILSLINPNHQYYDNNGTSINTTDHKQEEEEEEEKEKDLY